MRLNLKWGKPVFLAVLFHRIFQFRMAIFVLVREIMKTLFRYKGFIQKLPDLFRMFRDIIKGVYKPRIWGFLIPILALIYLIFPLDFVPDFIPIIGFVDDITLVLLSIPKLMKEVEKYLIWKDRQRDKKIVKTIDVETK